MFWNICFYNRNCLNLQYLSLAYCGRFTDKGFLYLTTGKGCHSLIHLNLSGCTQVSWYATLRLVLFRLTVSIADRIQIFSFSKVQLALNKSSCCLLHVSPLVFGCTLMTDCTQSELKENEGRSEVEAAVAK